MEEIGDELYISDLSDRSSKDWIPNLSPFALSVDRSSPDELDCSSIT